jgi:D-xylonolactonase
MEDGMVTLLDVQLELLCDYECLVGEGPQWHDDEHRAYWVDIYRGALYQYDPASGGHSEVFRSDLYLGGFTIQHDGTFIFFMQNGTITHWDGHILSPLFHRIATPHGADIRFNDVSADPVGRVFCGLTALMPSADRRRSLYRLDPDGSLRAVVDGLGCSNGIGFTPSRDAMYLTDSADSVIWKYPYDLATGRLGERHPFVTVTGEKEGTPDGMTVDADGYVWSARWGGHKLVRHHPDTGDAVAEVRFPVERVSSVTFGGPGYSHLYVTTARGMIEGPNGPEVATSTPPAGALFRVDLSHLGIRGVPEPRSNCRLPDA